MLDAICREFRIDTEYWDIWGRRHQTCEATKRAILASMGLDAADDQRLTRSALAFYEKQARRLLDPVAVLSNGAAHPFVDVRIPPGYDGGTLRFELLSENGHSERRDVPVRALPPVERSVQRCPLPFELPLGYHQISARLTAAGLPDVEARQRLIVAPDRAYLPPTLDAGGRTAGIAVSLYGVRSGRNWGIGDFTDLAAVVRWAARTLKVSLIGLNPLHAIQNREPFNLSPYLPLSTFYRNFIYLDVERASGFAESPLARKLVRSPAFQSRLQSLREAPFVDYESVARLKRLALKLVFRDFLRLLRKNGPNQQQDFQAWRESQGGLLQRFSTFCALDEFHHRRDRNTWIWHDWPEPYRDPSSEAVAGFARARPRAICFHDWLQWQIDVQLAECQRTALAEGMEIGLYHDLALATDRCGADFWAYRRFFVEGCRVGSPPDDFAPEGQDWAFPPPQPEAQIEDGYRQFTETIRQTARHGGALRIDHVMRFFRLFWIPEGMHAKDGTYVRERWQDLIHILALESVRGRFMVVGEDLGTCPPELRDALQRHGILSYKLFYFEKGEAGLPKAAQEYDHQALVSSTTHDLPTLAGFWSGRDIETRRAAGLLPDDAWYARQWQERRTDKSRMLETLIRCGFLPGDFPREAAEWRELTGEIHNAVIGLLASTPSMVFLLNQEDLTKETEQQNLPGTTWQYPNWKRKMKLSVEQLEQGAAQGFTDMFHHWLERTGRASGA